MSLYQIVRSKGYKNFMAKLYGWGAALVIMGALFKIIHLNGADYMLMAGMGTEALIFFFSAFEPLHKEYDWALVYPELGQAEVVPKGKPTATVTQQLDNMLAEAKIGPDLIDSLASGMRNLSENAKKLSYTTDAAAATEGYVSNLSKAKDAVQNLTGAYEKSANAISATSDMQVRGAQELFDVQKQHAQKLQNTLSNTSDMQVKSVQEMFEMQKEHAQKLHDTQMQNAQKIGQLQDQSNQVVFDNFKKIQDSVSTLANSMSNTVTEAQKYKDEVDKLSKNVAQINAIYANMLAAMTNK